MQVWISRNGETKGPYSEGEIQGLLYKGEVSPTDYAWHDGMKGWILISNYNFKDSPRIKTLDSAKINIHKNARNYADATVYTLNNDYLTQSQKIEVEIWFQLPFNISEAILIGMLIFSTYSNISWYTIFGIPYAINIFLSILNCIIYNKTFYQVVGGSILFFFNVFGIFVYISFVIFMFFKSSIMWGIISLISIPIFTIFNPGHVIYYCMHRKYKMNCKYAFFKKHYGLKFPFEYE